MKATVIRNGRHQGELFVEVSHTPDGTLASPLRYAVPVSGELPLGSIVEIEVKLVETPVETPPALPTLATRTDVEPLAIETSPIAPVDVALAPTSPSGQASDEGAAEEAKQKSGRLPADFPHRDALEAAGINTYAQARKLDGNYSEVDGVGAAKGKEIDAAL